jgi:NAD(P)-dependent dehydrogenase (short-subunit alcohol dehydrogenase family)
MATICLTGATDGIGLATARLLLRQGHRVLVHARTESRGAPVIDTLAAAGSPGVPQLVTGDLGDLGQVRALAEQVAAQGPLDVLVHNAGVWARGSTPPVSADGFETTFAVNVLAPHLLTTLLADRLTGRLVWLGSGMAGSGRPDPERLGAEQSPAQAYADSKACDVALAQAWQRRRPGLASAALDPGWVRTKLASAGAPGTVDQSADSLAYCCTEAELSRAPYWKDRRPVSVPRHLRDLALQDALALACDRLIAPWAQEHS